ncbi:MAG: hypothetical protein A2Z38_05105 [Planctomycetes bacterium RBG_19FT_COMBO_48_8]|nr:MAG: hypothetical protein A2Z38_05105 [Planctomycetes bacterium RBG_19FT_COMBO_48_8]
MLLLIVILRLNFPTRPINIDSLHHKTLFFNINRDLYYDGQDQFQQYFHKQGQTGTRYIQEVF